jgi:hypothetical protein
MSFLGKKDDLQIANPPIPSEDAQKSNNIQAKWKGLG